MNRVFAFSNTGQFIKYLFAAAFIQKEDINEAVEKPDLGTGFHCLD